MKITVITVCLNSVHTIEKTIKSVIEQEYHDLEYIVVDGGSTDGTLDILEKYDTYIHKWISEPDEGIFDAMNKGIGMASGDVIAFLNSDDWYEPNALKIIEDIFNINDCDCVYCDNYVVNKKGDTVYFKVSTQSSDDIYMRMICYHSAIFCRKEFFERKGNFNLKYKIAADYDWFLRMNMQGLRVHYISQPVFTFCYGGISSVNEIDCAREAREIALYHLPAEKNEYRELIDKRFYYVVANSVLCGELGENLKEHRFNILWGAGVRGRQCIKLFYEANIAIHAVVDSNRAKWDNTVKGVRICSPDILEQGSYNLIITPDNDKEIEEEIDRIGNHNIKIFKFNTLWTMVRDNLQI